MNAPAALGVRLPSQASVHAAIDRTIDGIAQHGSFARGASIAGDQNARLPRQPLHRMFRVRKIKNWDPADAENVVVHLDLIADVQDGLCRKKTPFGFGKLAGSDAAVRDDVTVWSLPRNRSSFESYRVGRAERGLSVAIAHADRAGNLLERSCLGMQVVVPLGRLHVVIVRSAIQSHVSARGHLAGLTVIRDLIATKDVIAKIDLA